MFKHLMTLAAVIAVAAASNEAYAAEKPIDKAQGKPLKVYILAGQSNMEGQAKVETFDYIGDDPATAPMLKEMRGPDGKPRVCERVWISYLTGSPDRGTLGEGFGKLTAGYGSRSNPTEDGGKIGPEFTFGLTMEKAPVQRVDGRLRPRRPPGPCCPEDALRHRRAGRRWADRRGLQSAI